jgi:hypothetical protein
VNREVQRRKIQRFLNGKGEKDIDAFSIYQWIDRCYHEGWWDLALALAPNLPPHSLRQDYRKRLNFLLSECMNNVKISKMHMNLAPGGTKVQRRKVKAGSGRNRWGRLINARTGVMDALLEHGATVGELLEALRNREPNADERILLAYVRGHLKWVVKRKEIPGWVREGDKYRFPNEEEEKRMSQEA